MARLYMLFFALEVLLVVLALISCLSAEEGEVRALPRVIWVIMILLFPLVGSIVYFAAGRPLAAGQRQTWRPGDGFPEAARPRRIAPDDDPEFLRAIDRQSRRDDEDMLRRWEDDLRRREDELRKKDTAADDTPPNESA
jgi:Phospholipase_D-nuclease N-terminal